MKVRIAFTQFVSMTLVPAARFADARVQGQTVSFLDGAIIEALTGL